MGLHHELRRLYPETESTSLTRMILDHVGYPPSAYHTDPDQLPGPSIIAQINEIVTELHTGKPIQYILGYTYFCDLEISVNENTLIPRPETEELVFKIIDHCLHSPATILDIGTGSGCIALALKKRIPEASVEGIDVNKEAIKVASENGYNNRLEVTWSVGDILNKAGWKEIGCFDLIASNPPYVRKGERAMMQANVLEFEPDEALFVEDGDPLVYYRAIAEFSISHLKESGTLWVEINEKFGAETSNLFKKAGFAQVTITNDIHEKERFIRAEK